MAREVPYLDELIASLFPEESDTEEEDEEEEVEYPEPIYTSTPVEESPSTPSTRTTTTTTESQPRHFCLILFNNPKWSASLQRQQNREAQRRAQEAAEAASTGAHQYAPPPRIPRERPTRLDEQFVAQLRILIYDYMRYTTRPFPVKYFIDLTEQ